MFMGAAILDVVSCPDGNFARAQCPVEFLSASNQPKLFALVTPVKSL